MATAELRYPSFGHATAPERRPQIGVSGREPVACQFSSQMAARIKPPTPAMRTAPAGRGPVSDPRPERAMRFVSWLICRADMTRVAPKKPKSSPINVFMFADYSIAGMSANGRKRDIHFRENRIAYAKSANRQWLGQTPEFRR